MMQNKTLIVIAGPTAIGKTDLAIDLAKHFQTEIISADSRQFFREMEIGTAKPTKQQLSAIKHHFINSHAVNDAINVASFEKAALITIDNLFKTHNEVILAGGSGLYINAILNGFDELPEIDLEVRNLLNRQFEEKGIKALQNQLQQADPQYYKEVDIKNPQRIIRALEVFLSTGKPFSSFRTRKKIHRNFKVIKIALNTSRELLYQRINNRVDLMIQYGLVEEVRSLLPFKTLNALQTVGYAEIFDFLDEKISLEKAIEMIKQNTRRFAKRQLTWFNKDKEFTWFKPEALSDIIDFIQNQKNL